MMTAHTRPPRLSGAVMTHPRRAAEADALAALLGPGRAEVVMDPDPTGQPSALRTTIRAWSSVPDGATHRVVLHDDMLPSAGFWDQAEAAVAAIPDAALAIFAFWNSRNGAAVRMGALAGVRWVAAVNEYTPCTALILPADVAAGYAEYAALVGDAWPEDVLMYRYLKSVGVPTYIATPSLAEHQDLGSLSGNDFHGPRRSACFTGDAGPLPFAADSILSDLSVVPFFKHGTAQCAVRVPNASGVRWEHVSTERYLARLGHGVDAVEARMADLLRGREDQGPVDPVASRGTWLTAYTMGLVCRSQGSLPDTLPDPGEPAWRELVETALGTIAPGGMCHQLSAEELEATRLGLAELAVAGIEAGLNDHTGDRRGDSGVGGAAAGSLSRAASRDKRVVVLGGSTFPGPQVARGLADLGHSVVSHDTVLADGRYPDVEYATASEPDTSYFTDLLKEAHAVIDLTAVAGGGLVHAERRHDSPSRPMTAWTFRLGELYGPGMPLDGLVARLATRALMSLPIAADPDPDLAIRLLHVDDLIAALDRALSDGAVSGHFDLANPERLGELELARLVAKAVRPVPVVHGPSAPSAWRATPPATDRAEREFGRRPAVDPRVGIRALAQWIAYESDVEVLR